MFVLTVDQDASRRRGDRVDAALAGLDAHIDARGLATDLALPFERTVGDEIQGVVTGAPAALDLVLYLQRRAEWSVGVGVGPVDLPLAGSARASSGEAFVRARAAVERAKGKSVPVPLALDAGERPNGAADEAEALVQLLAAVVRRRTERGWEVVDLLTDGVGTAREAASRLGITPQAVSQRLDAAMWSVQDRVHPLAERLLADLDLAAT
ncbi:hypothetical protein EXU48_13090 [Occultella glacieicola]|uniref:DNA-binding protein n=1 Tax=Occultella glacieicola TaxID=2518684 RepID=A0ABY2E1J0_9MICO|nr:hypothetical protein [Occultella glacieicola]TDE92488.1 hypothetical protein EXU48_13090 [Occultella glacieicola]